MALELKGKIIHIGNKNLYGNDGKYNCEFVIETQEQYPKIIAFEAHNEKCDRVRELSVGQEINVHFNLSSREYQGRYYTKATMWKFDVITQAQQPKHNANPTQVNTPSSAELPSFDEQDDAPPF